MGFRQCVATHSLCLPLSSGQLRHHYLPDKRVEAAGPLNSLWEGPRTAWGRTESGPDLTPELGDLEQVIRVSVLSRG